MQQDQLWLLLSTEISKLDDLNIHGEYVCQKISRS